MDKAEHRRNEIVANGGWNRGAVEKKFRYRPKTLLFCMLSLLWIFPSAGAVLILVWNASAVLQANSLLEAVSRITFEQ